jgi:hypothetical protein
MWLLAVVAAAIAGGPGGADPRRVAEHGLGKNGEGRVAVVFPDRSNRAESGRATIYLWMNDQWCRVGTGGYVRGSNRVDRGGRNPSIRLIDRRERADDMYWRDGRLILMRGGKQVGVLDVPANGCK